jgi:hypothetical protein
MTFDEICFSFFKCFECNNCVATAPLQPRDGQWSNLPVHGAQAISAAFIDDSSSERRKDGTLKGFPAKAVVNLWIGATLSHTAT